MSSLGPPECTEISNKALGFLSGYMKKQNKTKKPQKTKPLCWFQIRQLHYHEGFKDVVRPAVEVLILTLTWSVCYRVSGESEQIMNGADFRSQQVPHLHTWGFHWDGEKIVVLFHPSTSFDIDSQ